MQNQEAFVGKSKRKEDFLKNRRAIREITIIFSEGFPKET